MNEQRVRDLRQKEKFVVDDAYLNGMAKICGANATIAYMSLCRHASKTQECFPSLKLMAEQHGVSTRTILRGLQKLEDHNVIFIGKKRTKDGKWLNNTYTLLDKSVWNYSQVTVSHTASQVTNMHEPSDKNDTDQVTVSHTKVTHIKETHNKDTEATASGKHNPLGAEIIKAFETINPACKRMYGIPVQRQACDDLIESYGLEEVLKVIEVLPQTNGMEYVPIVTTPLQLIDKWVKLKNCIDRERQEHIKKSNLVI